MVDEPLEVGGHAFDGEAVFGGGGVAEEDAGVGQLAVVAEELEAGAVEEGPKAEAVVGDGPWEGAAKGGEARGAWIEDDRFAAEGDIDGVDTIHRESEF